MSTLKENITELVNNLKKWSTDLSDTDKVKGVAADMAKYADNGNSYGWKYKLEAPLKELFVLHRDKIGRFE